MTTESFPCIIRPLQDTESHVLKAFLYEAIYIPEGQNAPPKNVVDIPELRIYIEDFGRKKDDHCLVAEYQGQIVGAVWTRIVQDYGHIDTQTPSLAISLYKEYRNKGIGTRLMKAIIQLLAKKDYPQVSLSVQKANYAVRMYLKLGFKTVRETDEEYIMVKSLRPEYPIRQVTEQDIPALQELFCNTVLHVNSKDYTQEEVADWASYGEDMQHWKELLTRHDFIAALDKPGNIIGFSSMNAEGYMHSMFVHKEWQGKGVGTRLLAEAEKMAHKYDVQKIWAEVSITARSFFEKHGYRIIKEQKAKANRLYLTNYVMEKTI